MKLFVSLPMRGKTTEQIRREIAEASQRFLDIKWDEGIELIAIGVIDSVFDLDEDTDPLVYLGKSIELMARAEYVFFVKGWEKARGCQVEHLIAEKYGKEIVYDIQEVQ